MTLDFSHEAPLVSVLLPVRNAAPYLDAAIESVLGQSFRDFELLIGEDGSTDASPAIAMRHAACDRRIRVIATGGAGLPTTLNRLAATARGAFLARMDGDDICLPDRLARQVRFLSDTQACVAVGGSIELMDETGRAIGPILPPTAHAEIDGRHLGGWVSMTHPAVMIRRHAFEAVGGYDPAFRNAEDLDLWLRLAEIGELANLSEPVLRYRVHGASVSGADPAEQEAFCRRACEAAWARRGVRRPFVYRAWRPSGSRADRRDYALKYGWMAWNSGHSGSWARFALRALGAAPLSRAAWMLLVAGLLRRPATKGEMTHG